MIIALLEKHRPMLVAWPASQPLLTDLIGRRLQLSLHDMGDATGPGRGFCAPRRDRCGDRGARAHSECLPFDYPDSDGNIASCGRI